MMRDTSKAEAWRPDLLQATDLATGITFGEIFESDAAQIIAEAAQLRGVEVPNPDSDEYSQLVDEVRLIGELERDELYRGYDLNSLEAMK